MCGFGLINTFKEDPPNPFVVRIAIAFECGSPFSFRGGCGSRNNTKKQKVRLWRFVFSFFVFRFRVPLATQPREIGSRFFARFCRFARTSNVTPFFVFRAKRTVKERALFCVFRIGNLFFFEDDHDCFRGAFDGRSARNVSLSGPFYAIFSFLSLVVF